MADAKVQLLMDMEETVSKTLASVNKGLTGFQDKVKKMEPTFSSMAKVGAASFAAISGVIGLSINAYAESEAQLTRVDTILGTLTDDTLKQFSGGLDQAKEIARDFGSEIQSLGGIGDEAAAEGFAKLLSVTKDSTKAMEAASIAADLATYKQIDYGSAVDVVTKVVNGNTGALAKMGIELKEGATAEEALAALAEKTAGQYEAHGKTIEGQTEILKQSFGDLTENLGMAFVPMLQTVFATIKPVIDSIVAWTGQNTELVGMIGAVALAVSGLVLGIGTLGLALGPLITGIQAFMGVLAVVLSPIGLVVIAVAALAAGIVYLYNTNETARDIINGVWTAIYGFIQNAWTIIQGVFTAFVTGMTQLWTDTQAIRDKIMDVWNVFSDFFVTLFTFLGTILSDFITGLYSFMTENQVVRDLIQGVWDIFSGTFSLIWETLKGAINGFLDVLKTIFTVSSDIIDNQLKPAWEGFKTFFSDVWTSVSGAVVAAWGVIKPIIDGVVGAVNGAINAIGNALDAMGKFSQQAARFGGGVGGAAMAAGAMASSHRASGGAVNPNTPYIVGERKPEMFVPSTYGRIAPATGGGVNLYISGNNFYGADDLADMVSETLVRKLKGNVLLT